jgi:predicted nucleic acid binding AN1-type Zn finger protein
MFIQGFYIDQKDPILFDFDGLLMLGHASTFKNTGFVSHLIQSVLTVKTTGKTFTVAIQNLPYFLSLNVFIVELKTGVYSHS